MYCNPRIHELQEHREEVIDFIQSRPAGVNLEPLQENLTELEQEIDFLIELEEGEFAVTPDERLKSIKWLKTCYSGRDMGAVYPVEGEFNGFLFFTDDWGRPACVHSRYAGILFEEM